MEIIFVEKRILKSMSENEEKIINISTIKNVKNKVLTESDINALFLGLVKLIRKNANLEVSEELKKDCFEANENFRQSLIDLNRVEIQLKKEQEKNLMLTKKLDNEQKRFCLCFGRYFNKRNDSKIKV